MPRDTWRDWTTGPILSLPASASHLRSPMTKSLIVAAMVLGAHGAVAQTGIPMSRVGSRLEVMAGINSAKFNEGDPDARTGLVAGVGLIKPLAANWAFQPE